jgi:hypothetical protein
MVSVNHKCTIIDIVLNLILQLFKGQCQKGHYSKSVVEDTGEFLFLGTLDSELSCEEAKSVHETPHVVSVLVITL